MEKLTSDLTKDPSSNEIQQIVGEMDTLNKETHEITKMEMGDNYWGLMSELYLANHKYIEVTDQKYGVGASEFIGRALRSYAE